MYDTGIASEVAPRDDMPFARYIPIVLGNDALAAVGVNAGDLAIFEQVPAIEAGDIVLADFDDGRGSVVGRFVPSTRRGMRGYVATLTGRGRPYRHRIGMADWISGRLVETRRMYGARYINAWIESDGNAVALVANLTGAEGHRCTCRR